MKKIHRLFNLQYNDKKHLGQGSCTSPEYTKSDGDVACAFVLDLNSKMSWENANEKCKLNGARLPEIKTPKENEEILKLKVIQFPPLNRITLGRHKSDNNNRKIKLNNVFCVLFTNNGASNI